MIHEITGGRSYPLVADIVISAIEIDELLKWYGKGNTEYDEELYNNLKMIRDAMSLQKPRVKRIGSTDESRLNWH